MPGSLPTRVYREEETGLTEACRIVMNRKRWVFTSLVLCVSAAMAYLLLETPVYEADVKVRIGQVAGSGPFEPAEVLASRLLAQHGEHAADGVKRERPFLARALALRGTASTVELVAEAYRPADAVDFLNRVIREVQQSHADSYRQNVLSLTQRLDNLEAQRAALLRQYDEATVLLDQLRSRDPVQAALVTLERSRISSLVKDLDTERPSLTLRLTPPQTQPTEMLGEILPPAKAAAPRKALVLGIAALLGIVGGVALAFIVESVGRVRGAAT